jgi:flagellar P-ring protein precursor FlgI
LIRHRIILGLACGLAVTAVARADTTTVGELVTVAGAPTNQLYGYGLIVGLPGTGDQTTEVPYTQQSILNMLRNMGISLPNVTTMQPDDVASVMVTAEVPAFAHAGQHVDVTVSAVGNAASLAGGVLLPTPLRGGNGVVYAQAQGPLLVSGFAASANGNTASTNIPTVGSLPGGAIIATTIPAAFETGGASQLLLNTPSYQTAQQIADLITATYGPGTATAVSPGDLTVNIQTQNDVSQPGPFSSGQTVGVTNTVVSAHQGKASVIELPHAATLAEVAQALNAVGATPSDLVAIVEALKQAGAINGVIKVI